MAKYELSLETVEGMWNALQDDPVEFGKQLGKGLLDWDTWADDPARAIGHLVPDAIVAVATAGSGTAATRGAAAAEDGVDALTGLSRMDDLAGLSKIDDLGELSKLDDLGDLSHLDDLGDQSRIYSMWDDIDHHTQFAPEQIPSSGNAHSLIDNAMSDPSTFERHGVEPWSHDDLVEKINTPTADLSAADRAVLNDLRDQVPTPDAGTPMQKVITEQQFDDYMLGRSDNPSFQVDGTGGSMTRLEDTSHLTSPEALHDGLRLDYDNTPFTAHDETMRVIRFEPDGDNFVVPRNSDMDPGVGSTPYDSWNDPFTGNGFTKAGDDVIPEFQTQGGVTMRDGAEMWEVLPDGNQRLVGVLRDHEWIPQGN